MAARLLAAGAPYVAGLPVQQVALVPEQIAKLRVLAQPSRMTELLGRRDRAAGAVRIPILAVGIKARQRQMRIGQIGGQLRRLLEARGRAAPGRAPLVAASLFAAGSAISSVVWL